MDFISFTLNTAAGPCRNGKGRVLPIKIAKSPEFSVALHSLLQSQSSIWPILWDIKVRRSSWCGVGISSKDIELDESLTVAPPSK